jgi:hypothetical protein
MGIPKFKFNQPLKKDLSQLKLTDDDLVSGDFPADEIFQLKVDDVIHGFFWQYDLKDYVQQDTSFEDNTFIQKYGETGWVNLFDHPFFQRRKPQLVNKIETPAHAQEYYILEQGQKMGPFTIEEVKEQVHNKKAILTDMISLDDGHSWGKIYDLVEFDRRNEEKSFLPHTPEQEVLSDSGSEVKSKINKKRSDATEFIAGLAYIGKSSSATFEDEESDQDSSQSKKLNTKQILGAVAVVIIIAAVSMLITGTEDKNTKLTGNSKVQKDIKNKERIDKARALNNAKAKERSEKRNVSASNARKAQQRRAARRNKIRNSTPFVRSNTYKKASKARSKRFVEIKNDSEDDFYDNGNDPVEQDPVRRTLSKDTINPSEDDYDNALDEEDQYNEEENEDLGEEEPIDPEANY